jgi:hypothetical protein
MSMQTRIEKTPRLVHPIVLLPLAVLALVALPAVRSAGAAGAETKQSKEKADKADAPKDSAAKAFKVPNHGDLLLTVPKGWKDSMGQKRGMPPTIEFTDDGGTFSVQVSMIPPRGGVLFNSPENLRKVAEAMGRGLLKTAKEKDLSIQEVKGAEATGYFYNLTDKDPDPGGYEYITGGDVGVGDLLLTVTILYHDPKSPVRQTALDMLKAARQSRAPAATQPAYVGVAAPGATWDLVLPAKGFEIVEDQTNEARKSRQIMAVNKEKGLNLSVFMEPAPKAGDSAVVRDTYWGRARQSPLKKEGITLGKVGDFTTVQYMVPDVEGVPLEQKNLNLYLAHDGVWVDVHISKVQFTDKDQAEFDALANSIKVVEKGKAGGAGTAEPKADKPGR